MTSEDKEFDKWAWLLIFLLGGVLMIYGGIQDIMLYFIDDLPVASWHSVPPIVGLICGIIVLLSALLTIFWSIQVFQQEENYELAHKLARQVAFVSFIATITDWICGYYGFGSLVALILAIWLVQKNN